MIRAEKRILALLMSLGCAGCASHKTTIQTRNGTATVTTSQDNRSVTVQTREGTTSIGQGVDVAKLGVAVYPGAQSGQPASITTQNNGASTVIANFMTTDAFDSVYRYYKQRLLPGAEKMRVTSGNGSVASFQIGDRNGSDTITVQVSSDRPNLTNILITHAIKTPR
jgi:hypothetical protein